MNENEQSQHKSTGNVATVHWLYWLMCVVSLIKWPVDSFYLKTLTYQSSLINFSLTAVQAPSSIFEMRKSNSTASLCVWICKHFKMNEYLTKKKFFSHLGCGKYVEFYCNFCHSSKIIYSISIYTHLEKIYINIHV